MVLHHSIFSFGVVTYLYNYTLKLIPLCYLYRCIQFSLFYTVERKGDSILLMCLQEGWTALMAAANNGRYGVVDILLQRGANPDMQDQVSSFSPCM